MVVVKNENLIPFSSAKTGLDYYKHSHYIKQEVLKYGQNLFLHLLPLQWQAKFL